MGDKPIPLQIYSHQKNAVQLLNGEIYNFSQLRLELGAEAIFPREGCEEETIHFLIQRDGPEGIRRLKGMFAFA